MGIGYIKAYGENNKSIVSQYQKAKQKNTIIIDLRGYPNIELDRLFYNYFYKEKAVFIKYTLADSIYAGKFTTFYDSLSTIPFYYNDVKDKPQYYEGKIVVLVNENTLSNAEFITMQLQTQSNVTVVGSQTAGSDGNMAYVPLPGGFRATFSGLGVEYPDGSQTQRVGIKIDVKIKQTLAGVISGKDEILEAAIAYIKKQKQ